jgi:hypothetical protein
MIMNKLTLMQMLVPVLVPAAIAALKQLLPKIPKPWLPILAPLLGALIDIAATCQVGPGTPLAALLGAAGVGLREILDQLRKALSAADPPPPPAGPAGLLLLCALPVLFLGCKTPDETAFKTAASLEATVDRAVIAWAHYVVWKRAQAAPADALARLDEQEQTVRRAHTAYRTAMNAAYDARLAYGPIGKANATWQDALAAAQTASTNLVKLVDLFIHPPATPPQ